MTEKFSKILIAKFRTENECFCIDGELLILSHPQNRELSDENKYYFTGLFNGCKSKYGWSKNISEFTLDDFIIKYKLYNEDKELLLELFRSINKHPEGTPFAVDYRQQSFLNMNLKVDIHKVIFY